jgi:hypothetical protein
LGNFLYADYTQFEQNRNFIDIFRSFIDTSIELLNIEENIIKLNNDVNDRKKSNEIVSKELNALFSLIKSSIQSSLKSSNFKDIIGESANDIINYSDKNIDEKKRIFSHLIYDEIVEIEKKILDICNKALQIIENFILKNPIPILKKDIRLELETDSEYKSELLILSDYEIKYVLSIITNEDDFWNEKRKISELGINDVKIPIRLKKPWLSKNFEIEFLKLDDFYISKIESSDGFLKCLFSRDQKQESEKIEISFVYSSGNFVPIINHIIEGKKVDILTDHDLVDSFNKDVFIKLNKLIEEKINKLYKLRVKLKSMFLNQKDVILENIMSKLFIKIAEIISPIIKKIEEKSPQSGELILRFEEDANTRSEYFYKIEDALKKLQICEDKGVPIIKALDL